MQSVCFKNIFIVCRSMNISHRTCNKILVRNTDANALRTFSSLVCVDDFKHEAKTKLSQSALGFINTGALYETTLWENENAFQRWYIRPRVLIDVSIRDLSTTVLGNKVPLPFGVAPTGMTRVAHPEGECANAKAAARIGSIYTLSTVSTTSIEEVAEATGDSFKFFQLYIYKDRNSAAKLVHRAEDAGYKAIVLTVDFPVCGIRYADKRNKFHLPQHYRLTNFDDGTEKSSKLNEARSGSGIHHYVDCLFDPAVTWKDVGWLKSITSLPIILKGILTAEDALLALDEGVAAIWVSNHGGRQLDGVPPSIESLVEVLESVKGRCEVYVDGGFRTGADIFKALALGAQMVFLGRPLLWGLACNGEEGAFKILQIFRNEFDNTMALSGCTDISQISRKMVVRRSEYLSKL